eukprot:1913863-Amphidinium_carterae.1
MALDDNGKTPPTRPVLQFLDSWLETFQISWHESLDRCFYTSLAHVVQPLVLEFVCFKNCHLAHVVICWQGRRDNTKARAVPSR